MFEILLFIGPTQRVYVRPFHFLHSPSGYKPVLGLMPGGHIFSHPRFSVRGA
jgi:hypothetical protein